MHEDVEKTLNDFVWHSSIKYLVIHTSYLWWVGIKSVFFALLLLSLGLTAMDLGREALICSIDAVLECIAWRIKRFERGKSYQML